LPELSVVPKERFVVVAVGAGSSGRQWPIEKFAALLTELSAANKLLCVLVGTTAEQPLASQLRQLTNVRIADLCGRLTLAQSVRLIERGELLIANESGPMHIGGWCGTPVVGLVGGGHFGWFAPYPPQFTHAACMTVAHQPMPCFRCSWNCKFDVPVDQAFPCVRDTDADLVTNQALALLSEVRHQKSS
jgi:ADP-heptose:LPS heptosyltransferase